MAQYMDKTLSLTPMAYAVICQMATEAPHSGAYNDPVQQGSYLCRRCGLALFRAHSQFSAGCGWPSFDEDIAQAVKQRPDTDGYRIEILCARCEGHLGHVFTGEYFTEKNHRYCVNSLALDFVADSTVMDTEETILAGGCFWGVEHQIQQLPGVLSVEVGYTGGTVNYPTYDAVCLGNTGHFEAVRVIFDVSKLNFQAVLQHFFTIHDPTQKNGQGRDRGHQYQSAVFYYDERQRQVTDGIIHNVNKTGVSVATQVLPVRVFWPAEAYHQHYYAKREDQSSSC